MKSNVSPSEAVHGFVSWLLSRDTPAGPFSLESDAFAATELAEAFCIAQNWETPENGWELKILFPEDDFIPAGPPAFLPIRSPDQLSVYFSDEEGKMKVRVLWEAWSQLRSRLTGPEYAQLFSTAEGALLELDSVLRSLIAYAPRVAEAVQRRLSAATPQAPPPLPVDTAALPAGSFQKAMVEWVAKHWRGHAPLPPGKRSCQLCGSETWWSSPQPLYMAASNGLLASLGFWYLSCTNCGSTLIFNTGFAQPKKPPQDAPPDSGHAPQAG